MVNDEDNRVRESGNGSKTDFDFAFKYFNDTDVKVYKIDTSVAPPVATLQVLNTDYTLTASSPQGGTVSYTVAPTTDEDSFIYPEAALTQEVDIPAAGAFREEAIENGLDKTVMLCQQLDAKIDRALLASATTDLTSLTIEDPVDSRALKFRDDGSGVWAIEASTTDPDLAGEAAISAAASASTAAASASTATTQAGIAAAAAASVPTMATILASVMPVGFVVTLGVSTNPSTLYGFGTWSAIAGRVIVGINAGDTEFDTLNETGGVKSVTLSVNEMPSHDHRLASVTTYSDHCAGCGDATNGVGGPRSDAGQAVSFYSTDLREHDLMENTGGGQAHSNLQPYIVKYVWERTA